MGEQAYQQNKRTLDSLFSQPEIRGVYETQIPPEMNALFHLGCVCSLTPTAQKQRAESTNSSMNRFIFCFLSQKKKINLKITISFLFSILSHFISL